MTQKTPKFWRMAVIAGLLLTLYALTAPVNHSEANDAYGYARSVEVAAPDQLLHAQHLLYLPFMREVFFAAHHTGVADRAFPVMVLFSRICGVVAIIALLLLLKRRWVEPEGDPKKTRAPFLAALAGAGGLAFSYGFWRYSNEAEIYTPATCLVLLAWLAATGWPTVRNAVLGGTLAALGCLLHILMVLPTFFALPLFYFWQRRFRQGFLHLLVAGIILGGFYYACYGAHAAKEILGTNASQPEGGFAISGLAKGAVGLTQSLTAGNFLFAFEKFQHALTQLFPYRALTRQIFTAQHADVFARTIPFITLFLLLLTGLVLILRRLKATARADAALAAAAALWLGLHIVALLLTEPGNPENWVLALPPFWMLISATLYTPLAIAGRPLLPLLIAVLLGTHNYFGGLRLLADPRGDFTACKSAWLVQNAQTNDVILTADSFEFMRYLRYQTKAQVVHLITDALPTNAPQRSGRVFATAEIFDLPASIKHRFPQRAVCLEKLGRELAPSFVCVHTNEFSGVFIRQAH